MVYVLIGLHAVLGEAGALAFLWCAVEVLEPTATRLARARTAALVGTGLMVLSWVSGGYYYLAHYGPHVKPAIKAGSLPWAHTVGMELKEHVFLFLPFLGLSIYGQLRACPVDRPEGLDRSRVFVECALLVLLAFAMAGLGYIVMMGAHMYGGHRG